MVWADRGSGNHTRLPTSAPACLRAAAERAEQRPRVPALRPGLVGGWRRGAARGSLQCRRRAVIYARFRGEGRGLCGGLPRWISGHPALRKALCSQAFLRPAGRMLLHVVFCSFYKASFSLMQSPQTHPRRSQHLGNYFYGGSRGVGEK